MNKLRTVTLLVYTTIGLLLGLWIIDNIIISFPWVQKLQNDLSTIWYILERLIILLFGLAFFLLTENLTRERKKLTKWILAFGLICVLLPFRISVDMNFDAEENEVVEESAEGENPG
ncbi:MAG: hypothetical protein AB3N14_09835 [Flavobacteriaceae bacterium]